MLFAKRLVKCISFRLVNVVCLIIFARDGLFFLSFPSRALFKGLVTVETAFFLFDIAAFRIRRQTGPSIRLGDQFSSKFRKQIFFAHMPRHSPNVLPVRRPGRRLTFPFHYSFPFSSCHVVNFQNTNFFPLWVEWVHRPSHLQGQRKFSLKRFNFSQPESIRVNHTVNTLTKREGKGTLWSILVATKPTYLFGFTIFTFSASAGHFILECF
ncbi:unnamed protein product [Acanthosepion pharaonis]|uniref:Uncharacterized protein n=1 Tax=Acanthosepion pharaonis TaxID=158019 RepID=A0A812D626_ACAPH|nr:unnamed protein product [Sepia pharaonis]